jgi:predicted DNA-binding ribbon-helix-helix protein
MPSMIIKRSVVIAGHKTSVSLEDAFWGALKEIGKGSKMTLSDIVGDIDKRRLDGNLSSAIRLFVLGHFRAQISDASTDRVVAGVDMPQIRQGGRRSKHTNGRSPEHPER